MRPSINDFIYYKLLTDIMFEKNNKNVYGKQPKNNKNNKCVYKKLKGQDEIDFSSVKYYCSENIRDKKLEKAIMDSLGLEEYKDDIRYYYNRIDINDDNKPEVFVYLTGIPVCGTGGCTAAIFSEDEDRYRLLSKFTLVNNPIIITDNRTNGYRDIVMDVYGGGINRIYATMKYDGNSYPSNPSVEPRVRNGTKIKGTAIIADDLSINKGLKFK